ncbi:MULTISPECIES: ABC transporter ATP-binding protein [Brevibacillus]|jgi:iron complex transport system ATP-binding protein|uniref:Ferrichrome import ABC transporter ATP-binding protein FhuC n=1 Tax=Brevibacillus borstelensis AK1 TaxID=1300222 RepID=M8EAX3_9BACL|nr:ABC transporter ATP-binding protein [Brevibacillus borstelensis]EMT52615.1 ferrichrome import ABC transporter ATP-binding protein FhuC [Brevibacillus borstelensis AK1]KKX55105.1 iron-enterobactin transporter ATP-binding protein [Brevibacillus borstelensis cifa_chp40]MBE5396934.1 ABC transporter ATP-binding protein [Brevibacillus borstelensis]MCC0563822.1 ABC transporter ATP-binding protein [Brevibacillus borstelensis]MCM3472059.1 ABC transporter ATP-binding protein [Brevibacillus borstelens
MVRLYTDNVSIGYGERLIVKNLSVQIPDKKITTIIGSNGCGKSTLLKAITRIISHQSGAVILDGESIAKENTKLLAKKMAILPQTPESASGLTVGELVSYGRFPYQKGFGRLSKRDYEVIDWALEVTGTKEFKFRPVDALSGGQRQRVWIAMALAQETEIIFLDEPTTYLDMAHQLEVLELLQRLNAEQERTIVMVLHDLNQAARFADFIIALKDGEVVKAGDCEEVMTPEVLKKVFRIDAEIGRDPRTNKPVCVTYNLIKGD